LQTPRDEQTLFDGVMAKTSLSLVIITFTSICQGFGAFDLLLQLAISQSYQMRMIFSRTSMAE
jgi:hypothetical protein